MRYLTATAQSYVGVDLHARTLFVCVLDSAGTVKLARNMPAKPEPFLNAVAPYRSDLLVGCECVHSWYWLADTCRRENIPFALGHAFGIKAVHSSKTKSDAHDAEVIARLLRGGNFPQAYAYPHERRGLRDLLRTPTPTRPPASRTLRPHSHSSTTTQSRTRRRGRQVQE